MLTPLIENGKFSYARELAEVKYLPNAPQIKSYAGFLTTNANYNSNLYFWFFPNVSLKSK